uniref:protein NLP4-like n=1 Tax=Erigeron canadensis TaxID=72917 RepID=UPI001CB91E43|nr:protein NLP4-like [Erigeron canadensis]
MDNHIGTMFESNLDNDFDGGWIESPNISSSTLLDFSSFSYLDSANIHTTCFDSNMSSDETDMKPLDDLDTETFDDRLIRAIDHLNERCIFEADLLVQLWLPVIRNGKRILTTENLPFIVSSDSTTDLSNYREVSKSYHFAADFDCNEMIGLPGRVFLKKFPTCTPDLQFVAEENDPRVTYAQKFNLNGCINLPVFELDGETCLGVLEVVTTSGRVDFHDELENIFKALEVVDLRSSDFLFHPKLKDSNNPYEVVLAEIRDVLRSICDALKLPLAQTWSLSKGGPERSIFIVESASYVFDPQILGFFEACCVQQLVQGEGIAGKALVSNQPCFTDIDAFCRADYPLAHEARMFGLNGAVAIRVHSTYTGPLDFILEFFLPQDCKVHEEQNQRWHSIASMMKSLSRSLHLINDDNLVESNSFPVIDTNTRDESWISHMLEAQQRGENVVLSMGCHKEEPEEDFQLINQFYNGVLFSEPENQTYLGWGPNSKNQPPGTKKSTAKSRSKTERNVSLQVLQQYFPGSLKDAAKSIGVCPTTLKRICRQHGIMRWPSRKIKKVSHSLKKLQLVIDSVQGAEGMIKLGSFYTNFPELGSPVPPSPKPKANSPLNLVKTQETPSNSSSSGSHGSSVSTQNAKEISCNKLHDTKLLVRLEDDKLHNYSSPEVIAPAPKNSSPISGNEVVFRVKATYGDEKIRFKMSKHWSFADLQQEITKRFTIYSMCNITIEYMDDESEWVLLACDADLEECMDLHTSTKNQTIKLFLHQSTQPSSYMPVVYPNDNIHMW